MPELPEVETIKRGLKKSLVGLTILGVKTDTPKMILKIPFKRFQNEVKWKKVIDIQRKGKLLVINLNNNQNLIFHLKISGRILLRDYGAPVDEYTRIVFKLSKNKELRFADLRKFGWVRLAPANKMGEMLFFKEIGVDVLSKEFTFSRFLETLKNRRGGIKKFLMDQKIIAGIGNIYANEALWKARIHPERKIESLNEREKENLYKAILSIIKKAVRLRGTSVDQYVDVSGEKGEFEKELKVYGRVGKSCYRCDQAVVRIVVSGRGTFFCPKCQHLKQ